MLYEIFPKMIDFRFEPRHRFRHSVGGQLRRIQVLAVLSLVLSGFISGCDNKSSEDGDADLANAGLTLPEKDRSYLWDVEHHVSVLSAHGFSAMVEAIETRDLERLVNLFDPSFTGKIPAEEMTATRASQTTFQAQRLEFATPELIEVDRDGFAAWLLAATNELGEQPHGKASVMALRPEIRTDFDSPWQGRVRLRLWSDPSEVRPAESTIKFEFRMARPSKENLPQGNWVQEATVVAAKSAVADERLFRDIAEDLGVDVASLQDNWTIDPNRANIQTGGVYLTDFNRDGNLDLLITDILAQGGGMFYLGQPDGTFKDVSFTIGMPLQISEQVCFADIDGDGWDDLIQGNGDILRNVQGKRFEDVSHLSNLSKVGRMFRTTEMNSLHPADYDLDGDLDLYVCRSVGMTKAGSWVDGWIVDDYRNQLLRNDGNWEFTDVTEETGTDGGGRSVFCSIWFDANNDFRPDLYVIHEFGDGLLLLNQPDGTFEASKIKNTPGDFGSMGVTCGDYNNDGWTDIFVASMYSKSGARVIGNLRPDSYEPDVMYQLERMVTGNQFYRNRGNLEFDAKAIEYDIADVGWAFAPAFTDLNNDGFLDIFATTGFTSRTHDKPDG